MRALESIEKAILSGKPHESVMGELDWREFERTVGDILRSNDFAVRNNFRFRTSRRWENDLLAIRGKLVLCVDCKRWSGGREKGRGISKAAAEQGERTRELKRFLESNVIAGSMTGAPRDGNFVPMIVTLHQEGALRCGGTFVIPVGKLNSFILHIEDII